MADKHLHGQSINNDPALTDRVAFGTDSTEAENITWQGIINWLTSHLPFFNTANNLSEGNAATMRNNLGAVYILDHNAQLDLKADVANVIEKDSTDVYTPALAYHPANLKTVNDGGSSSAWVDVTSFGSDVDTSNTQIKVRRVGAIVFITGYLELETNPSEGDVVFTLPTISGFSVSTSEVIYFTSNDGNTSIENSTNELKMSGNTCLAGAGMNSDLKGYFTVSYPAV